MSRSDSTGKCPDPGVFCGYTREWCEGADNCPVVLEERRNAELERWRKQAIEENAAADALRDEVRRLKARLGAEEWTSPDMGCAGIMRRGKAMRNNDIVDELRMAITTGSAIRKRFKKQLWEIVTGYSWEEKKKARRDIPCIRCAHFKSKGPNRSSECELRDSVQSETLHWPY